MSNRPTHDGQGTAILDKPAATSRAVKLPPGPRLPKLVQGIGYAVSRTWMYEQIARRRGDIFTLNLPMFGPTVIVVNQGH